MPGGPVIWILSFGYNNLSRCDSLGYREEGVFLPRKKRKKSGFLTAAFFSVTVFFSATFSAFAFTLSAFAVGFSAVTDTDLSSPNAVELNRKNKPIKNTVVFITLLSIIIFFLSMSNIRSFLFFKHPLRPDFFQNFFLIFYNVPDNNLVTDLEFCNGNF